MQETAEKARRTAVLIIILISYLMIVLDISIVITGLPKIREGLGFSDAGLSWVQNAYTLQKPRSKNLLQASARSYLSRSARFGLTYL